MVCVKTSRLPTLRSILRGLLVVASLLCAGSTVQAADKIVAAGNRLSAIAPLYIAIEKGLFAADALEVSLVHLTSATEIGAGIASGSAQFWPARAG
jgi:ABC-type nitrate/sulfonate/bicarbonate transport system substrate-binding protein